MKLKYIVKDNKYFNIKDVLKSYFGISDRLLIKLKKNHHIYLNGIHEYVTKTININDLIEVDLDFKETFDNIVPVNIPLNIIFEDDSLIIINKPAGIPVHPSMLYFDNSLSNGLAYYFRKNNIEKKIRPVNRLDKDTSGIVVFAKNEYIQECLVKQMKSKVFRKEYFAILEGFLDKNCGTINAPISRKEDSIIEREINPNGDVSITHFELIKNFSISNTKLSFVKFQLETGRTHQIRVHSKYINHPILSDSLYGKSSNLISRQALHSYKISFIHPIKKEPLEFEIPLPDDMQTLLLEI